MIRWLLLLPPVLGVLAFDTLAVDDHAVKAVAILLAIAAAFATAAAGKARFVWTDVSLALWVFVAARFVMILHSTETAATLRDWFLLVGLVLLHHLWAGSLDRGWLQIKLPWVFGILGAAVGVYCTIQFFHGERQAHAWFANRNFAAAGLAMLLPFALGVRHFSRWILLGICAAGLFPTMSRGGLLAASAGLTLFAVWTLSRNTRWMLLAASCVVVLGGAIVLGEKNSVKDRLTWYEAAVALGAEKPVWGHGAGGFAREYPRLRSVEELQISGGRTVHAVHDDLLESWAEGGLIGIGAHLFLLIAAFRAARRNRIAAASLLAFFVAGLVDLPLQDPSLLALAVCTLTFAAEPRRSAAAPRLLLAAAAAACLAGSFGPWNHWRASQAYGAFLAERDMVALERTLKLEPDHPDALLLRGRKEDLTRLLELRPHHVNALYNLGRYIEESEGQAAALDHYRDLAMRYHDVRARIRIAQLVMEQDPLQAVSVLGRAMELNPRDYRPYLYLAKIRRENGQPEEAARLLSEAAIRLRRVEPHELERGRAMLNEERFELAAESLRSPGWSRREVRFAVRGVPVSRVKRRIQEALDRAEEARRRVTPPRVEARAGETPVEFAKRIEDAKTEHRVKVNAATRPHYTEARILAEALIEIVRDPEVHRLAARAAHGMGDHAEGRRRRATASFLKGLEALARGDDRNAARRLRTAFQDHLELAEDGETVRLLKDFFHEHPEAARNTPNAIRYLRSYPALAAVVPPD